jgi:hypothetical protein
MGGAQVAELGRNQVVEIYAMQKALGVLPRCLPPKPQARSRIIFYWICLNKTKSMKTIH